MLLEKERKTLMAWKKKRNGIPAIIQKWDNETLINHWKACLSLIKEQEHLKDANDYADILRIICINRKENLSKDELSQGFHGAVTGNHVDLVKYLSNEPRSDINQLDEDGAPPLFYAKSKKMLDTLFSCKANFSLTNKTGQSFITFVKRTDELAVAFNAKINEITEKLTCQLKALSPNNRTIIDCIQKGADVNTLGFGMSALHKVTASNDIKDLKTILSFPDIDLNLKTRDGRTALSFATSLEICMLLIKKGVMGTDFTLEPAVIWREIICSLKSETDQSTKQNLLNFAKKMLDTFSPDKLDVNAVDDDNCKNNMGHVVAKEDVSLIQELLIRGLDPNAKNVHEKSVASLAQNNSNLPHMAALFTENGKVLLALTAHIREQMERLESNEIFQKGKDDKRDLYKRLEGKILEVLSKGDIKQEDVNNLILETATISHHRRRRTRDKCLFFIGVEAESWKAFKKVIAGLQPNIQNTKLNTILTDSLKVNEDKMNVSTKDGKTVFGYDAYRKDVLEEYRTSRGIM